MIVKQMADGGDFLQLNVMMTNVGAWYSTHYNISALIKKDGWGRQM
jgi:hypothetical protein